MDTQKNYQPADQPRKDNRVLIYSLLAGALIVSWGYMFFSSKKAAEKETILTSQNVAVVTELDDVKDLYNESLFRLDSLIGENETLSSNLSSGNAEIAKLRTEISKILSNKNASESELKRARGMIKELNGKIEGLAAEVDRLQGENQVLASENTQVKQAKDSIEQNLVQTQSAKANVEKELENTKDIASTLKASNINIVAINEKSSGKEVETTSAKRADKMRINFNIDDNRIAQPGQKELYVVIKDPAGKVVSYSNEDVFMKRDGESQMYTSKVSVNYEGGKSMPVSFDWKNTKTFTEGNYKIEIYHNGFKIGEQVRSMKKGGLFN
jgi:outer membrane murein-binding lipoprotein Lpp